MRKIVMSTTKRIFALPMVACGVLIVGAGSQVVDNGTGDDLGAFYEQWQASPTLQPARATTAFVPAPNPQGLRPQGTVGLVDTGNTLPTRGDVLITCSADKDIIEGSVACASVGITTDNEFARCFDATFFPADMDVTSLDFGVEIAEQLAQPIVVTATLYSIDLCDRVLEDSGLSMLCTSSITLVGDTSENGTFQTISFTDCKVPAGTNVVAEIAYLGDNRFWPGSNPNGQTCLSYISADPCSLPDLTDLALIGFPDMHLILNLNAHPQGPPAECGDDVCNGSEDCCSCPDDCGDCVCGDGTCDEPCEDEGNCPDDCAEPPCENTVKIEITTDNYPGETSWVLVDQATGEVVGSAGPLADPNTLHNWEVCINNQSCYNFTIFDGFGDGICCGYGQGSYNVFHDGELVCSGGEFSESETCSDIGHCSGGPGTVTVNAIGPGVANPGETVVFEFMISADPEFLLRGYVITPPCGLTPQDRATGTVDGALIFLDETRSDWVGCAAPCNCTCAAIPVVDKGDCPGGDPRIGWATIFASDSPLVGGGQAYLAEVEYTVSGDATGSFDFEFVDPETPDEEDPGCALRDNVGDPVFANWIGTTVEIAECLVDGDCDDGEDCTIDTCGSENLCINQFRAAGYADVCLPYDPPDGPQPDLDDILCILDDFADGAAVEGCDCNGFRMTTDLDPCPEDGGGDGILGIDDIIKMLDAFGGLSPCDDPCQR